MTSFQMTLIGQIIGVFGFCATVLSYQTKKTKLYCMLQGTSGAFFTVSFLFLGSPTAAILNCLNVFRGIIFASGKKLHRLPVMFGILIANAAATAGTLIWQYSHSDKNFAALCVFGILTFLAQVVTTLVMWSEDGRLIRLGQFFFASPAWLANNVYFFSIPGILCESFTMISILISVIRFGWSGLAKGAEGTTEGDK